MGNQEKGKSILFPTQSRLRCAVSYSRFVGRGRTGLGSLFHTALAAEALASASTPAALCRGPYLRFRYSYSYGLGYRLRCRWYCCRCCNCNCRLFIHGNVDVSGGDPGGRYAFLLRGVIVASSWWRAAGRCTLCGLGERAFSALLHQRWSMRGRGRKMVWSVLGCGCRLCPFLLAKKG